MAQRFSIYSPPGRLTLPTNPFGKDVANLELFRALARHGGFEQLDLLSLKPPTDAEVRADLVGAASTATRFRSRGVFDPAVAGESGVLLRGTPELSDLAWIRRRGGEDRAYSLIGLIHTLAPPAIRQQIADVLTAPIQPWDALVCTSPSVEAATRGMLDETGAWLAERTGGRAPPPPALPVIPLGVDAQAFAALGDDAAARQRVRERLDLTEDDVLVLWVGRLSFFEKAFPQAMFRAVQAARPAAGGKLCFALAGWFPRAEDAELYAEAAQRLAPDVDVRVLDGNDKALLGELWAGGDIFLSLVDNIQETFGITPVEAMAAGLPVVASDWDGYRFTIRDGVEGFLVPTLAASSGQGAGMVARHVMQLDTYQTYVGTVAQHTAVHVGRCAEALARLIADPALRRRMGQAGRARVRSAFDWPVVVRQIVGLTDDLAKARAAAAPQPATARDNPVKGDPYRDFAGFPSAQSHLDLRLTLAPGAGLADLERAAAVRLDNVFPRWRATHAECAQAAELIAASGGATVREVLLAFPLERRRAVDLGLVWMAKLGVLDWLP